MSQIYTDPSLIHRKESRYYAIALIFSILVYIALFISIIGWFIIPIIVLVPLLAQALMMANIRINGVRITPRQFPEVYEGIEAQCSRMGFYKVPDIFVMESSGVLNAFASRFFGRNMIVLYSDLFDLIQTGGSKEVSFVIAHELAHIKRNHLTKQLFILPALWFPFIGEAYLRACEYTCDRMATFFTEDAEAAMNGLTILAIGKSLYKKVNREEYLIQSSQEKGFFVWLAERLSTHPPLPKRIHAIQQYTGQNSSVVFRTSKVGVIVALSILVVIIGASTVGIIFADNITKITNTFLETSEDELLGAALEGDLERVQQLLDSGSDPNVSDEEGWTALMWAAQNNDTAIAEALIEAGADLDIAEVIYEETALTVALYNDSKETVALLLEQGANANLQDSNGWTPLMTAASNGFIEAAQLLLNAGAITGITDASERTAADYALENGFDDLAELLLAADEQIKTKKEA